MNKIIPVASINDIPAQYRDTPIGQLIEYHNLNRPHDVYDSARLLIGMCMAVAPMLYRVEDNRLYVIDPGTESDV